MVYDALSAAYLNYHQTVVGRLGGVAKVAQSRDGLVEDTLARADQQDASLRVAGCHVRSPGGVRIQWLGGA
jgi:hypothetical protein